MAGRVCAVGRQNPVGLKNRAVRVAAEAGRAFWVALRNSWPRWASLLVVVKPETVLDWQRRRFRRYWTRISKRQGHPGRPRIEAEIRDLIRQTAKLRLDKDSTLSVATQTGANPGCGSEYRTKFEAGVATRISISR